MNLQEKKFKISDMTCTNCERKIEKAVRKLNGVQFVKVSYNNSSGIIKFNSDEIDIQQIKDTIIGEGYEVIENEETDKKWTGQIVILGIIILLIYLLIEKTIGFNFIPEVSQDMSYGILFVVGLLTSIHCVAMCGGINLSQCIAYQAKENNSRISRLTPSFLYNMGRVISYTLLGGLAGAIGQAITLTGMARGAVAIVVGIFMLIMGINMLNIFPWIRKLVPRMPKIFVKRIDNNKYGPLYIGMLNGLMPCGPLQTMQLYALGTGSFVAGALSMFVFSIGTVPLMFLIGVVSSVMSRQFTKKMMQVSAILVVILGIIMVDRGVSLSGISFNMSLQKGKEVSQAEFGENIQIIKTNFENGWYKPIQVKKGIPVKWIIRVTEDDINGCNNPIIIPKYNITKELVPGENIIEFTPDAEGTIQYMCWMGMIRSTITVVGE